jgi:hypothetical protein
MWCPACRCEYRPGYTECPDCLVALVAQLQPRSTSRPRTDHEQIEYDFSDWTQEERDALTFFLKGAEIPYGWELETSLLVVPHVHQGDVDEFVAQIEAVEEAAEPHEKWSPPR